MDNDLLSRLAELDAAPPGDPSAADREREERLLRTVLSDTEQPCRSAVAAFHRPLVRRVAFTLAGAVAACAALVTVTSGSPAPPARSSPSGSGPLSSAEVATWTSTAGSLDEAAYRKRSSAISWCIRATKKASGEGGPGGISNADVRGSVVSMIVTYYDHPVYCLTGSHGTGIASAIDPVAEVPPDGITLDTQGDRGSGSAQVRYVVGSMGRDVKKITVRDHGHTVHATVEMIRGSLPYGRWTAWWPDSKPNSPLTGTLTLTFTDGRTRTIDAASLTT
ncbi:hypothetical protein [Streptomyces sp. SAS_270]|uniref:hypothetical protein n=1 Tax=Streptomyces sp. SAS_270 TaxID=3412748 RepID=UPI00403D279F